MEEFSTKLVSCFYQRAPNPLTLDNLKVIFSSVDTGLIEGTLGECVRAKTLLETAGPGGSDYRLPNYAGVPVWKFHAVAGVQVPRMITGTLARAEDVNIFFETLAERLVQVDQQAQDKFDEKLKGYWGNIVTLFGAFIGVFALVVGFLRVVPMEANSTFLSVLVLSSAQVLPLAVVLGGFVWLLRRYFK